MSTDCVLSIHDVGSALQAAVASTRGRVLGRAEEPGPSNTRHVETWELRRRLERVIAHASKGLDDALCLGVCAGLDADEGLVTGLLAEMIPVDPARVLLCPVERMAAAGSAETASLCNLVAVRADVASRGWGVGAQGREVFKGGHGEVLGDEGSAAWIGREAARAAAKCAEKRHRQTSLEGRFVKHLGAGSMAELLGSDHRAPSLDRYTLAAFAPQVFEAAREGDTTSQEILDAAGRELAAVAISVVSALPLIDEAFSLLPYGSVFRERGPTLESFMQGVRNKTMRVTFLREGSGALGGGLLLALDHLGLKLESGMAAAISEGLVG